MTKIDKKNFDEKNFDKKILMIKILTKKFWWKNFVLFGDTTSPFHREIRRRRCGHAARDGSTQENEIEVASSAHEEMRDSFTLLIHFFL